MQQPVIRLQTTLELCVLGLPQAILDLCVLGLPQTTHREPQTVSHTPWWLSCAATCRRSTVVPDAGCLIIRSTRPDVAPCSSSTLDTYSEITPASSAATASFIQVIVVASVSEYRFTHTPPWSVMGCAFPAAFPDTLISAVLALSSTCCRLVGQHAESISSM